MIDVKKIQVHRIDSRSANAFVKRWHYSGKVVPNSQLHFGCFYDGQLHGVLQFGPSTDKRKTITTVKGTGWNEFIELNRMAFDDFLPKNSESRCIAVCLRLLKKHCPHIKWVLSFADATQCGDGTIYRAAGFKLVGIKANTGLRINPATGEVMHGVQAYHKMLQYEFSKWKALEGFQLKYVYLIDKSCELAVPELPYSAIAAAGAKMYKGKKLSDEVGSNATSGLEAQRSAS